MCRGVGPKKGLHQEEGKPEDFTMFTYVHYVHHVKPMDDLSFLHLQLSDLPRLAPSSVLAPSSKARSP